MSKGTWKVLEVESDTKPAVVARYRFDENGYNIEVSDFSRVWAESLSKQQIIERASEVATSIDPGEGPEQLRIFLGKIADALDRKEGTMLTVHGVEDGSMLSLHVTTPLPRPLPSFKWTLHLLLLPAQHVERTIVTPLLLHASKLKSQIESLIAELHDKDRVISKITDRLETSGNDLTTVFPGVSNIKTNRRKPQREQLARHVKGLSDFNEQSWKELMSENYLQDTLNTAQINDILMGLGSGPEGIADDTRNDPWWSESRAGKSTFATIKRPPMSKNYGTRSETSEVLSNQNEDAEDVDFQRQNTPPRLKHNDSKGLRDTSRNQRNSPSQHEDESTTEEEEDLDAGPSVRSPAETKCSRTAGEQARRDSPQRSTAQDSGKSNAKAKPVVKLGMIGGRKEKKSSEEHVHSPQSDRQSKLGMIGGKSSNAAEQAISSPGPRSPSVKEPKEHRCNSSTASSRSGSPPRARDDALDGGHEVHEQEPNYDAQEKTPDPETTSQERADQKRDLLKRELEQKAKAPTRKRRKF